MRSSIELISERLSAMGSTKIGVPGEVAKLGVITILAWGGWAAARTLHCDVRAVTG